MTVTMETSTNVDEWIPHLFGGIPPNELDSYYPIQDVYSTGMPRPGPDFLAAATDLVGINADNRRQVLPAFKRVVNELYRAALYKPTFSLAIKHEHTDYSVQFLPGHIWRQVADGPRPSTVMVLGKCPGDEEIHACRNFVGKTSQILVQALCESGLTEHDINQWYVANLLRFIPPIQKDNIPASWIHDCMPILAQELRIVQPDYILCLGREAPKAILGPRLSVTNSAGRVHQIQIPIVKPDGSTGDHPCKVVTSIHPAYVARKPEVYGTLKDAVQLFVDTVRGPTSTSITVPRVPLEREYIHTAEHLRAVVDKVLEETKDGGVFALDCEWHGRRAEEGKLLTVQFSHKANFGAVVILHQSIDQNYCVLFGSEYYSRDDVLNLDLVAILQEFGVTDEQATSLVSDETVNIPELESVTAGMVKNKRNHKELKDELTKRLANDLGIEPVSPDVACLLDNPKLPTEVARDELTRLLTSTPGRPIRIAGYNLKADLPWLLQLGIDLREAFMAPPDDKNGLGFIKSNTEGGFDAMLAAHAITETGVFNSSGKGTFSLELVGMHYLKTPKYDFEVETFKDEYCQRRKIKKKQLPGYGVIPGEILWPYAAYDVDVTRQLFDVFNGTPQKRGLLDRDENGCCSREAFWVSQRATVPFCELETSGLLLDQARVREMRISFQARKEDLIAKLRQRLNWPGFNPNSPHAKLEMLYGEQYNWKRDADGNSIKLRPEGALSLYLTPKKTTGRRSKDWSVVVQKNLTSKYRPAADKESLGALFMDCAGDPTNRGEIVRWLRDYGFVSKVLDSLLRPPLEKVTTAPDDFDDDADEDEYDGGIMSFADADLRVRTHIYPIETGRVSSSSPNLQNISKRREPDYARILGDSYKYVMRSIFQASPGHVLVEADYVGAELAMSAWMSGDTVMADHCRRALLSSKDPNYYDIHSSVAVSAFQLPCAPTKDGLKSVGQAHLRDVAKTVAFGILYGRGKDAVVRAVKEEGIEITPHDAEVIQASIFDTYPRLRSFFDACKKRVSNPGWLQNWSGRLRRFYATSDKAVMSELERQAMNFTIQSGVADAVSLALANLYDYRKLHPEIQFKIVLQVHDALMLEVPTQFAEHVYDVVLPECMTKMVPIFPTDLEGTPLESGPYFLETERKIQLRWGENLTKAQAEELGLPLRLAS